MVEYVDDVPAALHEMHRVLRPDARLVLWDVDWATVSWHAVDRDLMERALASFDKHLVHPSLPRTLSAQLRACGFADVSMEGARVCDERADRRDVRRRACLDGQELRNPACGMNDEEATRWRDEQRALADTGEFFFSVTQFCFAAAASPATR